MPSDYPRGDRGRSKSVKDFGVGPYDAILDMLTKGEDDEAQERIIHSLPDDGGSEAVVEDPDADTLVGYPVSDNPQFASGILPGDQDRPPQRRKNKPSLPPAARGSQQEFSEEDDEEHAELPEGLAGTHSELPVDSQNPPAFADYYDRMSLGRGRGFDNFWADEDTGSYSSEEKGKDGEEGEEIESLPVPASNDVSMEDFLGALGNWWSGFTIEDMSNEPGFPSPQHEFQELKSETNEEGGTLFGSDGGSRMSKRTATNIEMVRELAAGFLKEFGKKDLTRRHVLAYLQQEGHGFRQYIASDIIRFLKLDKNIHIKDVMDEFPVIKSDVSKTASDIHSKLVNLHISNLQDQDTRKVLMRCAADFAKVMAKIDKLES